MDGFNLNRSEKLLFALLRLGFGYGEVSGLAEGRFDGVSAKEWSLCYGLACKQGVMALAWDGVMKLPKEQQPPLSVKIPWAMAVERYEKRYALYCSVIEELSSFYRSNGIATVQLKGVGLSSYYPKPHHREGGDIDIYTFALENLERAAGTYERSSKEASCSKENGDCESVARKRDRRANELADELMRKEGIEVQMHSYKHSNFNYRHIPIENHKFFLNVQHYKYGEVLDLFLRRNINPKEVVLQGCSRSILVPSLAFNSIFVPFHAFQHYGCGLTLHHLCDWAVLLQAGALKEWPGEIDDKHFLKGIAALSVLSDTLLGTDSGVNGGCFANGAVDMESAKALAGKMLKEMICPEYENEIPFKGRFRILIYKTRRLIHRYRLVNEVIRTSLLSGIWKSVVAHVKEPMLIFKTK